MAWQLRDPVFDAALADLIEQRGEDLALAGAVGAQIYIAAAVGLDKRAPAARGIELVALRGAPFPTELSGVPIAARDGLGFERSIEAAKRTVPLGGRSYPVAAPEHVLGILLASAALDAATKWTCFALMRSLEGELDLEEVRGFVKRSGDGERESLLHELAYLAA